MFGITFGHPGESPGPQSGPIRTSLPWQQIVTVPAPRRAAGRRLQTLLLSGQPDMADRLVWSGPGAGGDATASAILADVIAIARTMR